MTDYVENVTLTVSPTYYYPTAAGGTQTETIKCNAPWTVNEDLSWVSVSKSNGSGSDTFNITVAQNTSTTARYGYVHVKANETSQSVFIYQYPAPYLEVTPTYYYPSASGGIQTETVSSNTTWKVSESLSWVTVSKASGSNNSTFNITVAENTTSSARAGYVAVSCTGISRQIYVYQYGVQDDVNPKSISLPVSSSKKTTITVKAGTGTKWTVSESLTWLTVSKTSGKGNGSFTISADGNLSTAPRAGYVYVYIGGVAKSVYVSQGAASVRTVNIVNGQRVAVQFTAPSSGQYVIESTNQGSLDPKAFKALTGTASYNDDGGIGKNFQFTQTLTANQPFTFYAGLYSNKKVSGTYYVYFMSSATPTGVDAYDGEGDDTVYVFDSMNIDPVVDDTGLDFDIEQEIAP